MKQTHFIAATYTPAQPWESSGQLTACDGSTVDGTCSRNSDDLGECDGTDPNYGYDQGKPCMLLKFNKVRCTCTII